VNRRQEGPSPSSHPNPYWPGLVQKTGAVPCKHVRARALLAGSTQRRSSEGRKRGVPRMVANWSRKPGRWVTTRVRFLHSPQRRDGREDRYATATRSTRVRIPVSSQMRMELGWFSAGLPSQSPRVRSPPSAPRTVVRSVRTQASNLERGVRLAHGAQSRRSSQRLVAPSVETTDVPAAGDDRARALEA
jgi:hypothetical protein